MKILVAGIGNIFMGDDGFGCEVARRLSCCVLPAGVDIADFGIRGMDLGYALMDGYELAILIDTIDRSGPPGTMYVFEPKVGESGSGTAETDEDPLSPHAMDPATVLRSLGERAPRVILVGCQPGYLGGEHGHLGLSAAVAASIEKAASEVRHILDKESAAQHNFHRTETESRPGWA